MAVFPSRVTRISSVTSYEIIHLQVQLQSPWARLLGLLLVASCYSSPALLFITEGRNNRKKPNSKVSFLHSGTHTSMVSLYTQLRGPICVKPAKISHFLLRYMSFFFVYLFVRSFVAF